MVDLDDVAKLVSEADVFTVGFANFPERLIVDTRSDMNETPMVQVVEPASGPRDRLAWLQRRRPSLGAPRAFTFMAWPHSPVVHAATPASGTASASRSTPTPT